MAVRRKLIFSAVGVLTVAVLAACSNGPSGSGATGGPSSPVRTIHIDAMDSLRFDPESVTVEASKPIRFVVTNQGIATHEFVLGDEDAQMQHEQGMGTGESMEHSTMELPALTLMPGETQDVGVAFGRPGEILYGCHQPGHYAGGMVGTITVE